MSHPNRSTTKYLCFIDECGTHDMKTIQTDFPVFTLVGLLVAERYYQKTLVPRVKAFKIKYFGDDDIILHSREIRRLERRFSVLKADVTRKELFYQELNEIIALARLRIYAVVIDKQLLLKRFIFPMNPYDVSLHQQISLICGPPGILGINRPQVSNIIAESRGRDVDHDLQNEYMRIRDYGAKSHGARVQNRQGSTIQKLFPSKIQFVKKKVNVIGLQLADLAAYPISRAILNGSWDNPAAQVIATKIKNRLIVF